MHVHTPGELGALLRQARLERGWTQAELARHAHVSRELVVRTENGHPRLELEKLFYLLKALGQNLDVVEAPHPAGPSLDDLLGF
jgi:y4mF family transcriptional regulator